MKKNTRVIKNALIIASCIVLLLTILPIKSNAASETSPLEKQSWPFKGILGHFDKTSLRRGYEVYTQVCAACHGMRFLHYRDLRELGYSKAQVVALAALNEVEDGPNDEGEYYSRLALPSDIFISPFPNDAAARVANNNVLPPDLSLMVAEKAAQGGADFIYALMIGYKEAPEGSELKEGLYYNTAFKGQEIAMPPPLFEDIIDFSDGTEASIQQMGFDVAQFLAWAADPSLEQRKRIGLRVIIFLGIFLIIAIMYKRRVWTRAHS